MSNEWCWPSVAEHWTVVELSGSDIGEDSDATVEETVGRVETELSCCRTLFWSFR